MCWYLQNMLHNVRYFRGFGTGGIPVQFKFFILCIISFLNSVRNQNICQITDRFEVHVILIIFLYKSIYFKLPVSRMTLYTDNQDYITIKSGIMIVETLFLRLKYSKIGTSSWTWILKLRMFMPWMFVIYFWSLKYTDYVNTFFYIYNQEVVGSVSINQEVSVTPRTWNILMWVTNLLWRVICNIFHQADKGTFH